MGNKLFSQDWLYRRESNLVVSSSPVTKTSVLYIFSKAYCYLYGKEKFLAVRRVGLMTRHDCRIDRPFPVTWLGNVWEPTPPRSTGLSRLFNPCFPGLKSDTVMLSCSSVTSYCGSHSSTSSATTTSSPTASSRLEHRVSIFPFFVNFSAFFCGLPFCPLLCFFQQIDVRVVLYFGPLAPRLAASVVAHWGGNRTVPWP